jgi:hypothetical protein
MSPACSGPVVAVEFAPYTNTADTFPITIFSGSDSSGSKVAVIRTRPEVPATKVKGEGKVVRLIEFVAVPELLALSLGQLRETVPEKPPATL